MTWQQRNHAPLPGTYLCRLDELTGTLGREFIWGETTDKPFRLFLVPLAAGRARAYVNACPHFQVPLNPPRPDWPFLLRDEPETIRCSVHGARFRAEDGLCTWGDCHGESLLPVPVDVQDGQIFLATQA
ncbi:MAG: Rieske 2Fe-2S domain-containing protein [Magnetococcales bacterium]|nr:Rieske 2Fe-2S domain-containing protein [Magnetococcales bacterium]MBF0323266.1 Rieske 2Fe-2S domain-containing protein [Magnetococcales bacterium]